MNRAFVTALSFVGAMLVMGWSSGCRGSRYLQIMGSANGAWGKSHGQ